MQSYLKKENLNIKLKLAPSSMRRINTLNTEKFVTKQTKREITIVTHASYWDLIGCILAIFNKKNKKYLFIKDLVLKRKKLFIRLHPSLNKNDALKEIKKIKEIPNYINIEFIDNSKESLFFHTKVKQILFFWSLDLCKFCNRNWY